MVIEIIVLFQPSDVGAQKTAGLDNNIIIAIVIGCLLVIIIAIIIIGFLCKKKCGKGGK